METSRLLQIVGQSKSASVVFDGSAWLGGNHTIKENGIVKSTTVYYTKNISFGRIDMTFENGKICTLSFSFNTINIILFARPQEWSPAGPFSTIANHLSTRNENKGVCGRLRYLSL
jgi:hypothetical protein